MAIWSFEFSDEELAKFKATCLAITGSEYESLKAIRTGMEVAAYLLSAKKTGAKISIEWPPRTEEYDPFHSQP